jgi:hypothetical protein
LTNIAFGQVSGTILMDSLSLPGAVIKFKNSDKNVMSDFDGNFYLPTDSTFINDTLIISWVDLSIEIKNFKLDKGKAELGNFEIPYFKYISIMEFEQFSELEKKNCQPTYCWGQLLGYRRTDKLGNEYLTLNCKEKITEFEFKSTTKTIVVDWNLIKNCK